MVADILKTRIKQAIQEANEPESKIRATLAEQAEVSLQAVGLWINTGKISLENLLIVANVLNKSTDWLLGRIPDDATGKVVPLRQEGVIADLIKTASGLGHGAQYELLGYAKRMAVEEQAPKANPAKS